MSCSRAINEIVLLFTVLVVQLVLTINMQCVLASLGHGRKTVPCIRVYFSKNPSMLETSFPAVQGRKVTLFSYLAKRRGGTYFRIPWEMKTQYRFTPLVRKTAFIVINFLFQKEDQSEIKYA